MLSPEVVARIRRIHIITSRRVSEVVAGQYQSTFKGRGLAFEEVREYVPGDDVRHIDWNVTARMAKPYVKVHREERELTVCICVDTSPSMWTGTGRKLKLETAAEISAVLAFSAVFNNDKVSLILFDDEVREFLPPRKGSAHVWRVIRSVITARARKGRKTRISSALEHVMTALKRKAIVFVISDFEDEEFEKPLFIASRKHDVIPVLLLDRAEFEPPEVGLVRVEDPESGKKMWVDLSDASFRQRLLRRSGQRLEEIKNFFRSAGMDFTVVWNGEDVIFPLMETFRIRERRVRVA